MRDPTADVRLPEFLFGVADDQFVRGRGGQCADIAARLRGDSDAVVAASARRLRGKASPGA